MTYPITTFLSTAIFFILFALGSSNENASVSGDEIPVCGSPAGTARMNAVGKFMVPVAGVGNHGYKISTSSDSAQFYFNQGLCFYYGYHYPEAVASFKEASRFDPNNAMTYWGQAIAMGPFYNTYSYKMGKEVPGVVAAMEKYAFTATPQEQDLIAAMKKRYSSDFTNADRIQLDQQYVASMAELVKKYRNDSEMKILHVDAVMLAHRWDFYDRYGKEKPWTKEVVAECESILKNNPNHPAGLHYYIHLTEASRQAGRALNAADVLKDNVPGIGHMVHMSTHMYQRNGLYAKGVEFNERAHEVNNQLDTQLPWMGFGKDKSSHYYAVQSFCAMTAGMDGKATWVYDRVRDCIVGLTGDNFPKNTYSQYIYMIPTIAMVRLGRWDEILNTPAPSNSWTYAVIIDDFAKGIALVRKGKLNEAREMLADMHKEMDSKILAERAMPFNSPLQAALVGYNILSGEIVFAEGKHDDAIRFFTEAVNFEDQLIYREPHDWMIPARQFLGARLLEVNKLSEAENTYKEDLIKNPGNGWSLVGMSRTLAQMKKANEAREYEAKANVAFEAADRVPISSVY
jgi:tetratricopeptide (TPR) repeat protein